MSAASEAYNAEQEINFAREKLQRDVPNRLQELLDSLNKSETEPWFYGLISKLILAVSRACSDLYKTIDQDALPGAAWTARNVLELWVWLKYCATSRENARRFYEDALRDAQGLVDSLSKLHSVYGMVNEFEAPSLQSLSEVARANLGLNSIDGSYERIADAARSIGVIEQFAPHNAFLSKFAHPTAGLVIGITHQTAILHGLQASLTTVGLYFAGQCAIVLGEIIEALPTRDS